MYLFVFFLGWLSDCDGIVAAGGCDPDCAWIIWGKFWRLLYCIPVNDDWCKWLGRTNPKDPAVGCIILNILSYISSEITLKLVRFLRLAGFIKEDLYSIFRFRIWILWNRHHHVFVVYLTVQMRDAALDFLHALKHTLGRDAEDLLN